MKCYATFYLRDLREVQSIVKPLIPDAPKEGEMYSFFPRCVRQDVRCMCTQRTKTSVRWTSVEFVLSARLVRRSRRSRLLTAASTLSLQFPLFMQAEKALTGPRVHYLCDNIFIIAQFLLVMPRKPWRTWADEQFTRSFVCESPVLILNRIRTTTFTLCAGN